MAMLTLTDAKRIVVLFEQLQHTKKRLAEIELARTKGTKLSLTFNVKDPDSRGWGDVEGLKYGATFHAGELNDIAAIILARLSDQVAAQKRQIERDLLALGACP
jgi:hypothetical protein